MIPSTVVEVSVIEEASCHLWTTNFKHPERTFSQNSPATAVPSIPSIIDCILMKGVTDAVLSAVEFII